MGLFERLLCADAASPRKEVSRGCFLLFPVFCLFFVFSSRWVFFFFRFLLGAREVGLGRGLSYSYPPA